MAKGKQTGVLYRDHEIREDHSFSQGPGRPGIQKRYTCKVNGRTVKGLLDEIKARIDHHLDPKPSEDAQPKE